jgi:putative oxidoreductase
VGLLLLRLVVGAIFIAHGAQKLFTFGIAGVTQGFAGMGVPVPGLAAPVVAGVEFFGGIMLILGLLTPLVALLLILDMLGAILIVHGKNGLFLPNGYEFALTLLTANLALLLAGPGAAALDNAIGRGKR